MHAFLISGTNQSDIDRKVTDILHDNHAIRFDFPLQKIADVKDLKSLVKVNFPQKTGIVMDNFHLATDEAQNAFLKNLEEPQEKIIYILTCSSLSGILPTIVSRCEVLELSHNQINLSESEQDHLINFFTSSEGEKLATISNIKDRGEGIAFLTNLQVVGHSLLLQGKIDPNFIIEIQKALSALQANGNVQLQLTHMVVNSKSK